MPSPTSPAALDALEKLARGESTVAQAAESLGIAPPEADLFESIDHANVDLGRIHRCGFGEVIFGQGKSAELITQIAQTQLAAGQSAFVTRIEATAAAQVRRSFEFTSHNPSAHTLRIDPEERDCQSPLSAEEAVGRSHVAVVSAGSTDIPIADEAAETLTWMGVPHQRFDDVGVAGPARILSVLPRLRLAESVVVVAGMEGALPTVVGGHLAVPVFAVPTSVGYGANLGGMTPLLSMLSSCTANVAVVNVDAGFKGGYLAGMVASRIQKLSAESSPHASIPVSH